MGFQNLSYWTMVHNFHQQQFEHITSSPYFLQSNGEAERAVRTIKRLLNKKGDPYLALPAYRITPLEIGYSPLQLLMSRLLRTAMSSTEKHVVEAKSTWFHFCANKRSTAQVQTEEKLWQPPWRQRVVTPQSRRYCLGSWPEQWGSRYSNQVDNYPIRSLQIVPSEETAKTWLFFLIQMQLLPVMRSRIRMIQMIWMQSIWTLEQNNSYVNLVVPLEHQTVWIPVGPNIVIFCIIFMKRGDVVLQLVTYIVPPIHMYCAYYCYVDISPALHHPVHVSWIGIVLSWIELQVCRNSSSERFA